MKKILKFELYNAFSSRKVMFCFLVNMVTCLGANVIGIMDFFGRPRVWMRSFYDMSFVMPYAGVGSMFGSFVLLLPILGGCLYSNSFYEINKNKGTNYIFTRVNPKHYIYVKEIVIAIVSFTIVTIPLTINFLINIILFEKVGRDNNFSLPAYDIGIQNYDESAWLDFYRIQNPLLHIFIIILIAGVIAASLSILIYSITFITKVMDKNEFLPMIIVYLIYIGLDMLSIKKIDLMAYLYWYSKGISGTSFIICISAILLISNIIIYIFGKKNWCEGSVYDD